LVLGLAATTEGAEVWAVNAYPETITARLALSAWTLDGNLATSDEQTVTLLPNQATELGEFRYDVNRQLIIGARLLKGSEILARIALWPEPFKYLTLPDPNITLERAGDQLTLRAVKPAKAVWLEAGEGVGWSDNLIDLLPGEDYAITVANLADQEVNSHWLK
jgi:beta-mannosidase